MQHNSGGLRKLLLLAGFAAVLSLVVVSAFLVLGRDEPSASPRAVIVDQLSLTFPNPTFVQEATTALEQAGFKVDYFPGEKVNVEFYKGLPSDRHDLILLRVHSGLLQDQEAIQEDLRRQFAEEIRALSHAVFLFTSEPYSEATHREEQIALRLLPVRYYGTERGFSRYFAITPEFIKTRMRGEFDGATIVLMGCDGLTVGGTADAFMERGAEAVVGWDGLVSAEYTDEATELLLEHLAVEGLSVGEAVELTMQEVGPDPVYDSVLRLYPAEEAAFTVP